MQRPWLWLPIGFARGLVGLGEPAFAEGRRVGVRRPQAA